MLALSYRAVFIGLLLSAVSILWIHQASLVQAPGNVYAPVYLLAVPPVPAVFCLILLVALVPLSGRLLRRRFSNRELGVVYMLLVIAIPPTTFGIIQMLIPFVANPLYFQTAQDNLLEISEAMPKWFHPHDPDVVRQMYEGSDDGSVPWKPWLYPLTMWTVFMTLLFATGLCLVSLFRKQWVERERLRFPLLFIPMSIVEKEAPGSRTSFFRNPLVWIALALVTIHHAFNVMHAYNPAVMALGDRYPLGQVFTERPWTAYRGLSFFHRPQMIGLAYFVSLDVLFSGWLFHLLQPTIQLLADVFGLQADAGFPFVQQQGTGAYLAMMFMLFWLARGHISQVVRKAISGDPHIDDSDEFMPYRWALFGSVGGFAAIIIWTYLIGFSPKFSIPFFAMILGFGLVYARVRAETGVPSMWAYPFNQHGLTITNLIGTAPLVRGSNITDLVMMGSFTWISRGFFTSQMGYQIENEALAHEMKISSRALPAILIITFVFGCVIAYYLNMKSYYGLGALVLHGGGARGGYSISTALTSWNSFSSAMTAHTPPNSNMNLAVAGGAAVTVLLVVLRQFWMRSPLHPLGYVAILNHGYALWGPFFVTWVLKAAIHRLGGARLYRQLMPFFLGLAMADLLLAGISRIAMAILGPDIFAGYIVHFG